MDIKVAIEFFIQLLSVASVILVLANRLRVPFTVTLVNGGLVISSLHHLTILQIFTEPPRRDWLTLSVVLVLFLPPFFFSSSINTQIRHLRKKSGPDLTPNLMLKSYRPLSPLDLLFSGFSGFLQ